MKRITLLILLAALLPAAHAQRYTHIIYIPGDGEHHFGINVAPTYSPQYFGINAEGIGTNGRPVQLETTGSLTGNFGLNAGLFYGYETRHGRTLEWGNYSSLYYSITPFSGSISVARDGQTTNHTLRYMAQRVVLHLNPFLSYLIDDQWSVSAGLGLSIGPQLGSSVSVDGTPFKRDGSDTESNLVSLIMGFINLNVDANAGVKYWFTDEVFLGLRLQYTFFSFSSLSLFTDDQNVNLDEFPNGVASINLDDRTSLASYFLPKSSFQTVLSVGYVW